jgi:hypothetical protein
METNSVSITFTNTDLDLITPAEFANYVYKTIPKQQLTQFREDRYIIGLKTEVAPAPKIDIIKNGIIQTWYGTAVEQFSKELFDSSNWLQIVTCLNIDGWNVSRPKIYLKKETELTVVNSRGYGDELFPVETTCTNFCATDDKQRFEKNKKILGEDWYYYNNAVTYTVNSKHYRCKEFENIDWANSIILLGCSIPFGVGLDDTDCLSVRLEQELKIPVINLSIPGAGPQFSLDTSVLVKKLYGKVKGIVYVWSSYNRSVLYKKPIKHIGAWNIEEYKPLTDTTHAMTSARLAYETSKLVWEDTPRVDCSYFPDTAVLLNIKQFSKIDLARDLSHPGIESVKQAAAEISKMLARQF